MPGWVLKASYHGSTVVWVDKALTLKPSDVISTVSVSLFKYEMFRSIFSGQYIECRSAVLFR